MKRMVRAKVGNKSRVANLKRKGITSASQGLTEEGEPLPKPAAIDLSAADADEDAEGGEEAKYAGKEPADGDPDPSNDGSKRLLVNPSKKRKSRGAKETAPSDPDYSSDDKDSNP